MKTYKTANHPNTGKAHVVGYIGNGKYMQIAGPFTSTAKAEKWIESQRVVDRNCRAESRAA